ncbi:helix-turn-helix domain of resolvase family protein [Burkholderia pseudomallei MSHR435]|nr:helix-turn-helix domain of resolvase family protein [Burkholderia pseudomallei MSHR435]
MPTTVSAPETLSETRTQTRELLLQTALSMLEQGWFPSITELANASGVSRATAYRYFPSQAALVSTVVDESLGPVLQWQPTSTSVEARVNELLDFAYPRMEQHEGALRAALQVALHQWANERARRAQDEPKYRRGNRRRLLTLAVEPMVRAGVDPAVAERLAQALSLLYGTEAMVVLKDIWGLDFRQFMNVIKWMSSALVRATLAQAGGAAGAGGGAEAGAGGAGVAEGAAEDAAEGTTEGTAAAGGGAAREQVARRPPRSRGPRRRVGRPRGRARRRASRGRRGCRGSGRRRSRRAPRGSRVRFAHVFHHSVLFVHSVRFARLGRRRARCLSSRLGAAPARRG